MFITDLHKSMNLDTEDKAFNYLIGSLKSTIKTYDYYVAWNKVLSNISKIEIPLNILNSLIGKDNIEQEMKILISNYPEVVPIIPLLIACRDNTILIADIGKDYIYKFIKKDSYTNEEMDNIVTFSSSCGLLKVLQDKNIKNLVDYSLGVEVGLDSNARKNRSGTTMENLIEIYVNNLCNKYNYRYLTQATALRIKAEFNINVPTDKANRQFDFVICTNDKLYLIEVNNYSGGGSKLKSVAGEFKSLSKLINNNDKISFVWITEGKGWNTAKRPLLETVIETKFVYNIKMIEDGYLEEIITKGL